MSRALLKPDQTLIRCRYFTARLKAKKHNSRSVANQSIWLKALEFHPDIVCYFGLYQRKTIKCNGCGRGREMSEEKMTDVNIATQLLVDTYRDNYDTALVISGDGDLTPPIRHIRENFPDKRVIVVFPPKRHSELLRKAAYGSMSLGEDKLRKNLLPDKITTDSGFVLQRPDTWC